MPTSTKAAISSEVATGRRMNGVEMLMRDRSPVRQPPVCRRCGLLGASFAATLRALLQARLAVGHDDLRPSSSPLAITATVPSSRATSTACRATVESGFTT